MCPSSRGFNLQKFNRHCTFIKTHQQCKANACKTFCRWTTLERFICSFLPPKGPQSPSADGELWWEQRNAGSLSGMRYLPAPWDPSSPSQRSARVPEGRVGGAESTGGYKGGRHHFSWSVKNLRLWSSHDGSAVMNTTSIHEDVDSIPGFPQRVKDLALLQTVV